jgi:hypothetical protein
VRVGASRCRDRLSPPASFPLPHTLDGPSDPRNPHVGGVSDCAAGALRALEQSACPWSVRLPWAPMRSACQWGAPP